MSNSLLTQNEFPLTLRGLQVTISNSNFTENVCESVGALLFQLPAGHAAAPQIQMSNCIFRNNTVSSLTPMGRAPAIFFPISSVVNIQTSTFGCNIASETPTQPPVVFASEPYTIKATGITIDHSCPFACELGEFSYAGIVDCVACDSGSMAPTTNATSCIECPFGYYALEPKSAMCLECDNGTFANTTGSAFCLSCLPGTYSGRAAQNCAPCPDNTYSDEVESKNCTLCDGKVVDRTLCTACDVWFDGSGCAKLSYLSYGMMGAGVVVLIVLIIAIVLIVKKSQQSSSRGEYDAIPGGD